MYIWGTANPVGEDEASGNTAYFSQSELDEIVRSNSFVGVPVKIEHKGGVVGRVLSAWQHAGRLDCLIEVDPSSNVDAALGVSFVSQNVCKDLSLGYSMQMSSSGAVAGSKRIQEVSLVRRGARDNCHIRAFIH
jgi:hypothetical protein